MRLDPSKHGGTVLIPSKAWDEIQLNIDDAIDVCNDITGQIANHEINGVRAAKELISSIDGQVRAIRKLIETVVTPF